jgi:hypothetical protein
MRDPWKDKYFGPVEEVFLPKEPPPQPYTLHWEFRNGHKWHHYFNQKSEGRNQRTEIRGQKSDVRIQTSGDRKQ